MRRCPGRRDALRLWRFQLEAAIQSVLVQSRLTGADLRLPTWTLHGLLAQKAPTIGNLVGLAAATAEVHGPEAGLYELAQLPEAMTGDYQPFWALKAQLLLQLNTGVGSYSTPYGGSVTIRWGFSCPRKASTARLLVLSPHMMR